MREPALLHPKLCKTWRQLVSPHVTNTHTHFPWSLHRRGFCNEWPKCAGYTWAGSNNRPTAEPAGRAMRQSPRRPLAVSGRARPGPRSRTRARALGPER